jgi:chromate reductase, NAD(P)H dehydrogenase (quinone)
MAKLKVVGICGSLRVDSWNLKLLRNFLGELDNSGFETKLFPSLEMPLMNEDLEKKPLDSRILAFRDAVKEADIVAIASPEYNGSFTPALKNAVDWATRPPGNLWAGKTVVLLGATEGGFGTIRGSIMLRTLLGNIKAWVLPDLVLVPQCSKSFDSDGKINNEATKKQIHGAIEALKAFAAKML